MNTFCHSSRFSFPVKNRNNKAVFKVNNEMKGLKEDVHWRGKKKSHLEEHLQELYK